MGDQLQQIVSRPDQGVVVAHPSTLAYIERIGNSLSPMPSRIKAGMQTLSAPAGFDEGRGSKGKKGGSSDCAGPDAAKKGAEGQSRARAVPLEVK
jgi:hypothetical protein